MAEPGSPERVLDTFQEQVKESLNQYNEVQDILRGADASAKILKSDAEDTVFRLASLWEVFQGRWYVAAISKRPERFRGHLNKSLRGALGGLDPDAARIFETFISNKPRVDGPLKMSDIQAYLDPNGYNVSFSDWDRWKENAVTHLEDPFKDKVIRLCQDREARSFVSLLSGLRNVLAHGSMNGMERFNEACRVPRSSSEAGLIGVGNRQLGREANDVRDVGKYLRARLGGNGAPDRVTIIHSRLAEVSEQLRSESV